MGLAETSIRDRMRVHLDTPAKRATGPQGAGFWFHYLPRLPENVAQVERGWTNQAMLNDGQLPPLNKVHGSMRSDARFLRHAHCWRCDLPCHTHPLPSTTPSLKQNAVLAVVGLGVVRMILARRLSFGALAALIAGASLAAQAGAPGAPTNLGGGVWHIHRHHLAAWRRSRADRLRAGSRAHARRPRRGQRAGHATHPYSAQRARRQLCSARARRKRRGRECAVERSAGHRGHGRMWRRARCSAESDTEPGRRRGRLRLDARGRRVRAHALRH